MTPSWAGPKGLKPSDFVLAATAGHEGLCRDGRHVRVRAGVLGRGVRLDPGSRTRRSGDPVAIATYLGVSDTFDASIDFPVGTRTRTRSTTRPSWTRSAAARSPPSKESDHLRAAHRSGLILHMAAAARRAAEHVACACPRVRTASYGYEAPSPSGSATPLLRWLPRCPAPGRTAATPCRTSSRLTAAR